MKKFLLLLLVVFTLTRCDDDTDNSACSTYATVKDLSGFDGCGFVFELEDGTRLEPLRIWRCGTPPVPKEITEDPLYGFEFVDGKRVRISYQETDNMSACMIGQIVRITCLTEVAGPSED